MIGLKKFTNIERSTELFKITAINTIQCPSIEYVSTREEVIYDIPIVIQGKKKIQDSLANYTATEFLNGDNQYQVEGKGKFDAEMFCKIKDLPPVLHFHLQRYDFGMYEQKNSNKI